MSNYIPIKPRALDRPEYAGHKNKLVNYIGARSYNVPDRIDPYSKARPTPGNPCVESPIFHKECIA